MVKHLLGVADGYNRKSCTKEKTHKRNNRKYTKLYLLIMIMYFVQHFNAEMFLLYILVEIVSFRGHTFF